VGRSVGSSCDPHAQALLRPGRDLNRRRLGLSDLDQHGAVVAPVEAARETTFVQQGRLTQSWTFPPGWAFAHQRLLGWTVWVPGVSSQGVSSPAGAIGFRCRCSPEQPNSYELCGDVTERSSLAQVSSWRS
jgi:hypothetical protein